MTLQIETGNYNPASSGSPIEFAIDPTLPLPFALSESPTYSAPFSAFSITARGCLPKALSLTGKSDAFGSEGEGTVTAPNAGEPQPPSEGTIGTDAGLPSRWATKEALRGVLPCAARSCGV